MLKRRGFSTHIEPIEGTCRDCGERFSNTSRNTDRCADCRSIAKARRSLKYHRDHAAAKATARLNFPGGAR